MKTLGSKISSLRKERGLTQSALADKLNISAQAISKWETDQAAPDISLLAPLAKILDTSIDYLLNENAEEPETIFVPEPDERDYSKLILKIRVINEEDKVNINVPFLLVKQMLASGSNSFSNLTMGGTNIELMNEDFEKIVELIESGVLGKIVSISTQDGTSVEIYVE